MDLDAPPPEIMNGDDENIDEKSHQIQKPSLKNENTTQSKSSLESCLISTHELLKHEKPKDQQSNGSSPPTTLWVWGQGNQGQLGNSSLKGYTKPTRNTFFDQKNVSQIFAGPLYSVALDRLGKAYIFGKVNGLKIDREIESQPELIEFPHKIVHVGCGGNFIILITEQGDVFSFGRNKEGQLGWDKSIIEDGDISIFGTYCYVPTQIPRTLFRNTKIVQVSCGFLHTLVLSDRGEVYSWGSTLNGRLGYTIDRIKGLPVTGGIFCSQPQLIPFFEESGIFINKVSCGKDFSAAICSITSALYTWGCGDSGQLGHGDTNDKLEPTIVQFFGDKLVDQVSCGEAHTICSTRPSGLWGWGLGSFGRIGDGTLRNHESPVPITLPSPTTNTTSTQPSSSSTSSISLLLCGSIHSVAVDGGGQVYVWGRSLVETNQQPGLEQITPGHVSSLPAILPISIACGNSHTLILTTGLEEQVKRSTTDIVEIISHKRVRFTFMFQVLKVNGETGWYQEQELKDCEDLMKKYKAKIREKRIKEDERIREIEKKRKLSIQKRRIEFRDIKISDDENEDDDSDDDDGDDDNSDDIKKKKRKLETTKEEKEMALDRIREIREEKDLIETAGDEYEVEKIVAQRIGKDGNPEYLIKWVGWDSSQNTWESEKNLISCKEELEEFKKKILLTVESKKRPQPNNRRIIQVEWVGQPKEKSQGRTYYKEISIRGVKYSIGDLVLVSGEDSYWNAQIFELYEKRDGQKRATLRWFYRPEDTQAGLLDTDAPNELYFSELKDENEVNVIVGRFKVSTYKDYIEYIKKLEESGTSQPKEENLFCVRYQIKPGIDTDDDEFYECDLKGNRISDVPLKRSKKPS